MGQKDLNCFFNPTAIAVFGASERENSLGAKILANLLNSYKGPVYAINPFRQTIQGTTAYPSIKKINSKVDLAIIATPAHTIPQIVKECGEAGVLGLIIVSAGFEGTEGQELTREISRYQQKYGIRIIGPNSYGVIRPKDNLYATFGDKKAVSGKIAFISQSAALCGTVLDWSQETHVGLSAVVSVGKKIDVKVSDLLEYFGTDAQTRAIMIYAESLTHIRNFLSAAKGYARSKPIIIVKAGRFHETHSFTLSSATKLTEDEMYDGAFRRIGIVRVNTIHELFDCAKALSMQPKPDGNSLTIVTNASGPGVLAADQLSLKGGKLSPISTVSAQALSEILPYYCKVANPIDILEEATPERYGKVLQVILNDSASGSTLLIYSPQGLTHPSAIAKVVVELSQDIKKTLLVALMGEDNNCHEARKMLNQQGIPSFRTPEEAVAAFLNMYAYTRNIEALYETPRELDISIDNTAELKEKIKQALKSDTPKLCRKEAFDFLKAYKIPTFETNQETSIINGYRLFLGLRKHRTFGSFMVFGTYAEHPSVISNVSVGFPPLNQILAKHLVEKTIVCGRDKVDFDKKAIEQVLVKFSQLIVDFPELQAADVNFAADITGIIATDASITVGGRSFTQAAGHQDGHLVIAPYPKKYCTQLTLSKGQKLIFRPVKSEDETRLNELFKSLSIESIRFRFFQTIKEMSHDALSRYCNIDYDREVAIVAQPEDNDRLIGVVRLIVDFENQRGEFAITVADAWQGSGLGSKLLEYMINIGKDLKLSEIYGVVSQENYKMLGLCKKFGFENQYIDPHTVQVKISLSKNLTDV